jgi:hypothetical protein
MKRLILVFVLIFLSACTKMVEEPKGLLSKEQMSIIIADFAIYDQAFAVKPEVNMELSSRYVLKNNNTTAKIYRDSYTYYLSDPSDMKDILDEAKEIILEKDPKLEEYIKKKKKENPGVPNFVK